ncbi:hypothetical protein E3N88_12497 [Mikania micrantha]|uniref:Uncharacterized protein n=1 Tax=Mikania micrantha TaxID=192012 RepID=A0A5N6P704_9ASTR|nr:hypothetical protein E3N88_12497 [Mikania micrantha]
MAPPANPHHGSTKLNPRLHRRPPYEATKAVFQLVAAAVFSCRVCFPHHRSTAQALPSPRRCLFLLPSAECRPCRIDCEKLINQFAMKNARRASRIIG